MKLACPSLLLVLCISYAQGQTVTVGSTTQQLSPSQRGSVSSYWPDGNLGAVNVNGTNYIFAPQANPGTVGITLSDLNNWSQLTKINTTSNLQPGGSNSFDQNYIGGGAVYYDSASGYLIGLYHGEQWFGGGGSPFYSAEGLAYSKDLGVTWHKLGEVLSPQSTWTANGSQCQAEIGTGTLLVVGSYFYDYFTDNSSSCTGYEHLAVARASISSVIAAVKAGIPFTSGPGTLFMKYTGNGSWNGVGVNDLANPQNGGGASATIASVSNGEILEPNVRYNSYLGKYVLAYSNLFTDIELAFSSDGLSWSSPTVVVSGGSQPSDEIYYPSLLNANGGDPQVLGQNFIVVYDRPLSWSWSNASVYSTAISVSGGSAPPPPTNLTGTVQ